MMVGDVEQHLRVCNDTFFLVGIHEHDAGRVLEIDWYLEVLCSISRAFESNMNTYPAVLFVDTVRFPVSHRDRRCGQAQKVSNMVLPAALVCDRAWMFISPLADEPDDAEDQCEY